MYKVKSEYLAFKFYGLIGGELVVKKWGELTQAQLKALAVIDPETVNQFTTFEAKATEAIQSDKK